MTNSGMSLRKGVAMLFLTVVMVTATACTGDSYDDPEEEGGIIGTGIMLRGAVSATALAAADFVEVKSSDGKLTQLALDTSHQFSATSLAGIGPWVLSVRTSKDVTVYAMAYNDGTRNINRFSDLSLRRWFAQQALDLDTEFDATAQFKTLPSAAEYAESATEVFQLIEPVLVSYDINGEDAISGNYAVDDQGIDGFLNRNSVSIENGLVSFLLTDRTTNTQSFTRSGLNLGGEFIDNNAIAPTVPESVRALGSRSDEIIVVWDPSVDDLAVKEYIVVRDGERIATTPYPVYTDSQLLSIQPYSYEIIAVDFAGNRSTASLPVLASPLLIDDDIAPPAPTRLVELATTGPSIQLLWGQSDISDVVRFNVFRGSSAQMLDEILSRVTSTFVLDTAVEENETYCYQVQAVDASNNLSERSDVLCVTAKSAGSSIDNANVPLADWNVPEDLDSLSCEQSVLKTQVQQGLTLLTQGCYVVPETLTIGPGATLRLDEGVVLKFGDAVKLIVPRNATLTVNGTPDTPVVLTGNVANPGYWGGIEFQDSTSVGNLLRGAVIQYAGGTQSTAAAISARQGRSRFRIVDTLIRHNQNMAINFNFNEHIIDQFQGNRITENDSVGAITLELASAMGGNSDFTGNLDDVVDIPRNGYDDVQFSMPDLGVPYSWNGVTITRGTLSIEPGTEIIMISDALVDIDGVFEAIGTADKPIVIRGGGPNDDNWKGLRLSGRGDKTLNHVNITNAGASEPNTGAIEVVCSVQNAANFSIDNAEITDSNSWGIFISATGCNTEIGDNVTYFDNILGNVRIP